MTPPSRWVLDLLGAPRLVPIDPPPLAPGRTRDAAARNVHALSRKDAAWLLLVAMEGPVASRRVAAAVWPQRDPVLAMNNLRQRVFRLRRQTSARVLEMRETLQLDADVALDPAVAGVLAHSSLTTGLATDVADAVAADADHRLSTWLDRDWLAGFDYPDLPAVGRRLRALRDRWEDLRVAWCLDHARRQEAAGAIEQAVVTMRATLLRRPLDEALHRRLIELHLARDDHAAALAVFEALECALRDELGIRPSGVTQSLLNRIGRLR